MYYKFTNFFILFHNIELIIVNLITMNNFKKLDKLAFKITSKIFKKYDYQFIKISENWDTIVGNKFYKLTSPKKITKDKSLMVYVENKIVMDFEYYCPTIIKNIKYILGNDSVLKIKILQKYN